MQEDAVNSGPLDGTDIYIRKCKCTDGYVTVTVCTVNDADRASRMALDDPTERSCQCTGVGRDGSTCSKRSLRFNIAMSVHWQPVDDRNLIPRSRQHWQNHSLEPQPPPLTARIAIHNVTQAHRTILHPLHTQARFHSQNDGISKPRSFPIEPPHRSALHP